MSNEADGDRRFFTTSEVARYCAVTNDGVLKWIKSGKLRAFSTPGGHYRISAEDFREFLQRYDMPIDESFFRGTKRQRTVLVVDDDHQVVVARFAHRAITASMSSTCLGASRLSTSGSPRVTSTSSSMRIPIPCHFFATPLLPSGM